MKARFVTVLVAFFLTTTLAMSQSFTPSEEKGAKALLALRDGKEHLFTTKNSVIRYRFVPAVPVFTEVTGEDELRLRTVKAPENKQVFCVAYSFAPPPRDTRDGGADLGEGGFRYYWPTWDERGKRWVIHTDPGVSKLEAVLYTNGEIEGNTECAVVLKAYADASISLNQFQGSLPAKAQVYKQMRLLDMSQMLKQHAALGLLQDTYFSEFSWAYNTYREELNLYKPGEPAPLVVRKNLPMPSEQAYMLASKEGLHFFVNSADDSPCRSAYIENGEKVYFGCRLETGIAFTDLVNTIVLVRPVESCGIDKWLRQFYIEPQPHERMRNYSIYYEPWHNPRPSMVSHTMEVLHTEFRWYGLRSADATEFGVKIMGYDARKRKWVGDKTTQIIMINKKRVSDTWVMPYCSGEDEPNTCEDFNDHEFPQFNQPDVCPSYKGGFQVSIGGIESLCLPYMRFPLDVDHEYLRQKTRGVTMFTCRKK